MTVVITEQPAPRCMLPSPNKCAAPTSVVRAQTRSKLKTQTAANEVVSHDQASLFDAKTEPFP